MKRRSKVPKNIFLFAAKAKTNQIDLGWNKLTCNIYMYMQCGLASCYNKQMVWFQKINIPTPMMVIGKSKGDGGLKSQTFKGKYKAKLENPGVGNGKI